MLSCKNISYMSSPSNIPKKISSAMSAVSYTIKNAFISILKKKKIEEERGGGVPFMWGWEVFLLQK